MTTQPSILIVDDEPLLLDHLELQLLRLQQKVVGRAESYDSALETAKQTTANLAILDINLHQEKDGIDLAFELNQIRPMAIIFLTSLPDDDIFKRARTADPLLYLIKPISNEILKLNLDIVWNRFHISLMQGGADDTLQVESQQKNTSSQDYWFVKERGILTKIDIADIDYLEADTKHTLIYTSSRKWPIRQSLKELTKRLPEHLGADFVQVHRSYVVNLNKVACLPT